MIDRNVRAVEIVHVYRVSGILKQLAVTLFAFAQRRFNAIALGDPFFEFGNVMLALFEQLSILNGAGRARGERFRDARMFRLEEIRHDLVN